VAGKQEDAAGATMMLDNDLSEVAAAVGERIQKLFGVPPSRLYAAAAHLPLQGGKRMRPFMVVKSCEAVGGKPYDAMAAATAIELLHNFTLIHDDLMDNDLLRRGMPTVHTLYGRPVAILAGDLLFAESLDLILTSGGDPERVRRAASALTRATITLSEGQYADMHFEGKGDVTEAEYLEMVYKKTAALFQAAGEMGAILGGGSEQESRFLGECGKDMGIGFQIFDDYLGVTSTEEVLGKSVGNDIREGKKTLLVIKALETTARERMLKLLGKKDASDREINDLVRALQRLGVLDYVLGKAEEHIRRAKASLMKLPDTKARSQLLELVDYSVKRKK
jgi:geranylgeranyl diphosphate synthase type I